MQKHTQIKDADYQKQYHGSRRILVVDITSSFKQALIDKGFEVEIANDSLLALKNFKEGSYDLLVLDIVMPEMDGFSLYEEVRK
jgi:DNA-binding response OmpR family regulator